jgi:hypothetical protein
MQDVKRIETYSLYEFCQEIETAIKAGFSFDFKTNENFPTAFGTMLTCGLVKAAEKVEEAQELTEVEETEETEVTETVDEQVTEVTEVITEVEDVANEVQDLTDVQEPTKRGPKPKNK